MEAKTELEFGSFSLREETRIVLYFDSHVVIGFPSLETATTSNAFANMLHIWKNQ